MSSLLCCGIDVSAQQHTVALVDSQGALLGKPFTVPNTPTGAQTLVSQVVALAQQHQAPQVRFGSEATSFYDWHLLEYLLNEARLKPYDPQVYRFNPSLIAGFKKAFPRKGKTDLQDAVVIAKRLLWGDLPAPYRGDALYQPLRALTRDRFHLRTSLVREKSYFVSQLFLQFSGLHNARVFANLFGATSAAVLTQFFSVDELVETPVETLCQFLVEKGRNRFPDPAAITAKLQYAARESYRIRPALASSLHLILATSLASIRALQTCAKTVDVAIAKEVQGFRHTLDSIPGIGPGIAAGLIAEIGDLTKFPGHPQVAKYAGLVWSCHQSGSFQAQETRLMKAGNSFLRYYLVEAASKMVIHSPYYKAYYQKKYQEVPTHQHKRALVLTARKVTKLIFAMLSKGLL